MPLLTFPASLNEVSNKNISEGSEKSSLRGPIRDGEYVFPDGLWITGGRRYWFLCDKSGSYLHSFDIDVYPDGDSYHTGVSSSPFGKSQASGHYISFNPPVFVQAPPDLYIDTNFRLRGRAITR